MKVEQRSYRGKTFRPTPLLHVEPNLIMIVTPWGKPSSAERAREVVADFILSSRNDQEATSPFQKMTCLSPLANNVRVAMMLLNDTLYREENRDDYSEGVEVLICARHENEVTIAQIGQPFVFLNRKGLPLQPLTGGGDMALEMSEAPELLSPLPRALLGLYSTSNFSIQSYRMAEEDRLVFLSRSHFPMEFLNLKSSERNLDNFSKILSSEHPDIPYWLAVTA
jgi:hypothetical protein